MKRDNRLTKQDQRDPPSSRRREWYLLSSHGIVFLFIAANPDCAIQQISTALFISRRTAWSLVGDLKHAEMISFRREGRTHHYTANVDFQLPHPAFAGRSMLNMMKSLMEHPSASPEP